MYLLNANKILSFIALGYFLSMNIQAAERDAIKYQPFVDQRPINLYREEQGFVPPPTSSDRAFPDDDTGSTDLNNPDPFLDDDQTR